MIFYGACAKSGYAAGDGGRSVLQQRDCDLLITQRSRKQDEDPDSDVLSSVLAGNPGKEICF